jgi:hypothetical protein
LLSPLQKPLSGHVGVVETPEQLNTFVVPARHGVVRVPPQIDVLTSLLEHVRPGPQLHEVAPAQHVQVPPGSQVVLSCSPEPGVTPGPHRQKVHCWFAHFTAHVNVTAPVHAHDPLEGQPGSAQHSAPAGLHEAELLGMLVEQEHPLVVLWQPKALGAGFVVDPPS